MFDLFSNVVFLFLARVWNSCICVFVFHGMFWHIKKMLNSSILKSTSFSLYTRCMYVHSEISVDMVFLKCMYCLDLRFQGLHLCSS